MCCPQREVYKEVTEWFRLANESTFDNVATDTQHAGIFQYWVPKAVIKIKSINSCKGIYVWGLRALVAVWLVCV